MQLLRVSASATPHLRRTQLDSSHGRTAERIYTSPDCARTVLRNASSPHRGERSKTITALGSRTPKPPAAASVSEVQRAAIRGPQSVLAMSSQVQAQGRPEQHGLRVLFSGKSFMVWTQSFKTI